MKKNIFLPALLLSFLTTGSLHAESIVMKKTEWRGALEPLSDYDIKIHGPAISDILLKYSWPMCQDSDLTPKEQHDLLSAEGNEQSFLERKLNEMIPLKSRRERGAISREGETVNQRPESNYYHFKFVVIFVPTTLYELFCLTKTESLYPIDSIAEANKKIIVDDQPPFPTIYIDLVSTHSDPQMLTQHIKKYNDLFYPHHILKSHQLFAQLLIRLIDTGNSCNDDNQLTDFIKKNISSLIEGLIETIIKKIPNQAFPEESLTECPLIFLDYITHEYQAHSRNQELISRGTKQFADNKIASTSYVSYYNKIHRFFVPYSLSFGRSLLASIMRYEAQDGTLRYLVPSSKTIDEKLKSTMFNQPFSNILLKICQKTLKVGFVIYIDKASYYKNKIDNLFFIPAISSLANLYGAGIYFHARSKAAVKNSSAQPISMYGATGTGRPKEITDEAQVLTVERDALEHELTFLRYFIDHFEIFYLTSAALTTTEEEKKTEILHAQCEAFVETYRLIEERIEKLARVLDAITQVAQEKETNNQAFKALLTSTPETADLIATDSAQKRIATLARHLVSTTRNLTRAKL